MRLAGCVCDGYINIHIFGWQNESDIASLRRDAVMVDNWFVGDRDSIAFAEVDDGKSTPLRLGFHTTPVALPEGDLMLLVKP